MLLHQLMRQLDWHGHQFGRFVARVAEHHALVAGAAGINAHGDVRRLALYRGHDGAGFGVEAILATVVADIVDYAARDRVVVEDAAEFLLDGDFTGDDNETGGQQRFAANPPHGVDAQYGVQHGVGNLVGNFIGVSLGNGFRGK